VFVLALNLQLLLFVILVGAGIVVAVFIYAVPSPVLSPILAVITLVIAVFAFATKYYTYLMVPALKMKGRTIVLSADEPFIIAPNNAAILMHEGQEVYASAFVKIPLYRSATEMSNDEKLDFARLFSRMTTLSKTPVKISSQMHVINKDEYITSIRNKLNEAQERYATLGAKPGGSKASNDRIKGEVTMWKNLMDNVSASQAHALTIYAMVSAMGGNEEEALTIVNQQAEDFAAGVSAIFGVSAYVVKGIELLTFIEPDHMIPVETVTERLKEKATEEAL
jgi:hypothetical protein